MKEKHFKHQLQSLVKIFAGIRLLEIPRGVLRLNAVLRHLYLHNCSLRDEFPFHIVHLNNLETLDLSQNGISVLPESFCMTGWSPLCVVCLFNCTSLCMILPSYFLKFGHPDNNFQMTLFLEQSKQRVSTRPLVLMRVAWNMWNYKRAKSGIKLIKLYNFPE